MSTNTHAATITFTDRALWEAAVNGSISIEDFNSVTPMGFPANGSTVAGQLLIETTNTQGGTRIDPGTGDRNTNGTNYLRIVTDGDPVRSAAIIFPFAVDAWGADFDHFADQTHVTFADINEQPIGPHNSTGFIGFVSDDSFTRVDITDPYISFSQVGFDNIAFAAVPEPTSIALWGVGMIGMGIAARRRRRGSHTAV